MCYNVDAFLGLQSVEFICICVLAQPNLVHLEILTSCGSENSHRRDYHLKHMGANISASNILDARHHGHTGTKKRPNTYSRPLTNLVHSFTFVQFIHCIYIIVSGTRAHTRQHSFVSNLVDRSYHLLIAN